MSLMRTTDNWIVGGEEIIVGTNVPTYKSLYPTVLMYESVDRTKQYWNLSEVSSWQSGLLKRYLNVFDDS